MSFQVLLTGFGAFGKVAENPSGRLARLFKERPIRGAALTVLELPVSYRSVPELVDQALERGGEAGQPFHFVLMLGVAAGSAGWRVERYGHNTIGPQPDAEGYRPAGERIEPQGPERLEANLPLQHLEEAIASAGLPVVLSESAGGYLCNFALYTALRLLKQKDAETKAGFLHIPADPLSMTPGAPVIPLFSFEQHELALEAALNALLREAGVYA